MQAPAAPRSQASLGVCSPADYGQERECGRDTDSKSHMDPRTPYSVQKVRLERSQNQRTSAQGIGCDLPVTCIDILIRDHISSLNQPLGDKLCKMPMFPRKKVKSEREADLSTVTQQNSSRWDFEFQGPSYLC